MIFFIKKDVSLSRKAIRPNVCFRIPFYALKDLTTKIIACMLSARISLLCIEGKITSAFLVVDYISSNYWAHYRLPYFIPLIANYLYGFCKLDLLYPRHRVNSLHDIMYLCGCFKINQYCQDYATINLHGDRKDVVCVLWKDSTNNFLASSLFRDCSQFTNPKTLLLKINFISSCQDGIFQISPSSLNCRKRSFVFFWYICGRDKSII